jgi:Protein kinase domain
MKRSRRHTPRGPRPVEVGTSVDGYRIERIVSGRPGVNVVAVASRRGRERVTLDIVSTPLEDDRKLRRQVPRLASIRGSIKHPNMLRMLRTVDGGQRLHLAGPPPGTVTLADRLRQGPLAPKTALSLLGQVAGALETSRGKGLLHRDLSPRAILVTPGDPPEALLTDFGLGTPQAAACELVGAVEDVDYRSPEEIRGEQVRPESNVYSLACILVECLTGKPPFPHERPLLAVHAHLSEPPPRVSERRAELPVALDGVVAKAMAKDPRERHPSAGALIRAAEESLGVRVTIPVTRAPRKPVAVPAPAPAPAPARPRAPAPAPKPAAAESPARERPARPDDHGARKRVRRPRQKPPRTRPRSTRRRARLGSRVAPAWAGLALLVSAVAGFAMGNGGSSGGPATPVTQRAAPSASDAAASPASVQRVIARLDERRAAARRKLRAASSPARQAATAEALAQTVREARLALIRAPGRQRSEAQLTARLQEVERAYSELAVAAREADPNAWQRSRQETLERETDLELLLRTT